MQSRLSRLILAPAVLAVAAFATIPAMAETTTVKVPFSFTVAGKSLPAGQYSIQRDTLGTFVRLQSEDASQSFSWVADPSGVNRALVVLKFDEAGQTHALRSIQYGSLVTGTLDKKKKAAEHASARDQAGQ